MSFGRGSMVIDPVGAALGLGSMNPV
jgi:hypothetical protein